MIAGSLRPFTTRRHTTSRQREQTRLKSRSEPGQIKATLVPGRSGWGRFNPPRPSGAVAGRHSHQSPAPAHHGQDPAQEPPHRHALHQTRRRSRRRDHRHPRPIPPQALKAFPACTLYISAAQRLLRWIYGQCYQDPRRGEDLPRGAAPRSLCARPPRSQKGAGPARRRFCGAGGTTFPARARAAGITTSAPSEVRTAKEAGSFVLENAQDVGDLFAVTRAGPAPADHDPLADIGGCEADLEPVAHAGHLFPGPAARRRVPGPGPGAWIVAGPGAAAGSGGRSAASTSLAASAFIVSPPPHSQPPGQGSGPAACIGHRRPQPAARQCGRHEHGHG